MYGRAEFLHSCSHAVGLLDCDLFATSDRSIEILNIVSNGKHLLVQISISNESSRLWLLRSHCLQQDDEPYQTPHDVVIAHNFFSAQHASPPVCTFSSFLLHLD